MIKPSIKVVRIDVDNLIFEQFMKSDCAFSDSSWDIVEDSRYSQATFAGDENYQLLKANYDEADILAKNANTIRKVKLNELRDYERNLKPKSK